MKDLDLSRKITSPRFGSHEFLSTCESLYRLKLNRAHACTSASSTLPPPPPNPHTPPLSFPDVTGSVTLSFGVDQTKHLQGFRCSSNSVYNSNFVAFCWIQTAASACSDEHFGKGGRRGEGGEGGGGKGERGEAANKQEEGEGGTKGVGGYYSFGALKIFSLRVPRILFLPELPPPRSRLFQSLSLSSTWHFGTLLVASQILSAEH